MTDLHARVDRLEAELSEPMVGAGAGMSKRGFAVLQLTRGDGTSGLGEASPLPGYSPDSIEEVTEELRRLTECAVQADPLATPSRLLSDVFAAHSLACPSSRFALETALLDWLGHTRAEPLHQLLGGKGHRSPIPISDLVSEPDPGAWPSRVDALLEDGATHLKLKIGSRVDAELTALQSIRRAHPRLPIRLDANRRLSPELVLQWADPLEALELELIEEPVAPEHWPQVIHLSLPFGLDETLSNWELSRQLLETGRVRAVVLKPTVLGGFRASFEVAERAAEHGVPALVSHTFEGPIARAAAAELALALQSEVAGLGEHPALAAWPPCDIAALAGRRIIPHDEPGLGLLFHEDPHG